MELHVVFLNVGQTLHVYYASEKIVFCDCMNVFSFAGITCYVASGFHRLIHSCYIILLEI